MAKVIDEKIKRQLEKKTTFFLKYFPVRIKNVVMDDIISTGMSYALFASQLETFGTNVLGGIFLGRTHYRYGK